MSIYLSEFAPDDLPRIMYSVVDDDQAGHISEAMTLPENQANFDVSFIPIDTPEARRVAAEEWATYKQALGNVATKERGAVAVLSGRDESPERLEQSLEKHLNSPDFAAHALLKVILKNPKVGIYDLMRSYYEPVSDTTNE